MTGIPAEEAHCQQKYLPENLSADSVSIIVQAYRQLIDMLAP